MLTFFREKKWTYLLETSSPPQLKQLSAALAFRRRCFFFSLRVGFGKELDPLSGMTVSLPKVDAWIQEFIETHSRGTVEIEELLLAARTFFTNRAHKEHAKLREISIHEERGWGVSWNSFCHANELFFESRHYLEYAQENHADLRQITLVWKKSTDDLFDYFHESLKLLKAIKAESWQKQKPDMSLSATSYLSSIRLESRGENWTLNL
jgi:hypothetical protein